MFFPKEFISFWTSKLDQKKIRFSLLISAGIIGTVLFINFHPLLEFFTLKAEISEYIVTTVGSIPVLMMLWYFRTRDVRQQVDKLQNQINQDHFNHAVENLTNISLILTNIRSASEQNSQQSLNGMIKEVIGVQSLIQLSETTPDFNELIVIIFQNKIKEFTKYHFVHNKSRSDSRKNLIRDMKDWLKFYRNKIPMSTFRKKMLFGWDL